ATSITCLPGPTHPLWTAMIAALGTVLVVDDDAVLRSSLESVLGDLGYRVLSTGSPDVAYQLLGTESALAVLLDVRLPTMSGLSLYLAMTHRWPRLRGRVALMTTVRPTGTVMVPASTRVPSRSRITPVGGPGSTESAACRSSESTVAVTRAGPAWLPRVTSTRAIPVESVATLSVSTSALTA